jgi:mono/diheme cytochrome c family protein
MSKIIIYLALTLLFVATSCYYDNEEALYPTANTVRDCDTAAITYTANIVPIITGKCNTCHSVASSSSSGGNIVLEGYSNLQKVAANGKLLGAISYAPGYSQMPKNANKLSYCEITAIRRWIESNTPNN